MKDKLIDDYFPMIMGTIVLLGLFFGTLASCDPAFSDEIPKDKLVECVVGEASGEPWIGQLAIVHALINRAKVLKYPLKGVYGCSAPRIHNEPPWVWENARSVVEVALSTGVDFTNQATHWESVDFPTPYWASKMVVTARIGKHIFYKRRKR